MKCKLLMALSLLIIASFFQPVHAALQSRLDTENGHTLGIGVFGMSYDYSIENLSIGTSISTQQYHLIPTPYGANSKFSANIRGTWRWLNWNDIQAGLIAGATVNSGHTGDRSYFQPDLGLGLAYQFSLWELPMALRLNVGWTLLPENEYGYTHSSNFLQRIGLGPSTGLELAFKPSNKIEFTLGGGAIMGMRLKF